MLSVLIRPFRYASLILLIVSGGMINAEGLKTDNSKIIYDNSNYVEKLKSLKPLVQRQVNKKAIVDLKGQFGVLLPEKERLVFKIGDKKTIVNKTVENKELPSTKGVWLHKSPNNLYALWWTKGIESKKLRIKTSSDDGKTFSENASIIATKGVLPSVYTADNGAEGIAVAFISERSAGYQLYFNRSLDAGKTWFEEDVLINDLYTIKGKVDVKAKELGPKKAPIKGSHVSSPFLTYINDKLVLVYQESIVKDKKVLLRTVSKTSSNFGKTWEEKEIFSVVNMVPQEMNVDRFGDELFISIFLPKKGVQTFTSFDKVQSWKSLGVLPNTGNLNSASAMRAEIVKYKDGTKRILSFTSNSPYQQNTVKFFEIDNDEGDWRNITAQITRKNIAFEGMPSELYGFSKMQFTDLATIGENFIIATWEDHTYLVPTIVYNYSADGGLNWQKAPLFINYPTKNVQKFPTFRKGKNRTWLLSSQFDLSLEDIANPPIVSTKVAEQDKDGNNIFYLPTGSIASKMLEEDKLKLLKKRATEYWNKKIKGKFGETHSYFEPIYRSLFPKEVLIKSRSLISYSAFKLGDIKRLGNISIMDTTLTFTLNGNKKEGMTSSDDGKPKTTLMKVRWGWFYDNWYIMPDSLFDRRRDL